MSDTTPTETALAALNETVKALAGDVKALKAEKDLDALIVQAKADRKISNAETEASVRAVGATSLEAARALVANLKVTGPEGGSVVDAAGNPAAEAGKDAPGRGVVSINHVREYAKANGIDTREALSRLTRRSA